MKDVSELEPYERRRVGVLLVGIMELLTLIIAGVFYFISEDSLFLIVGGAIFLWMNILDMIQDFKNYGRLFSEEEWEEKVR